LDLTGHYLDEPDRNVWALLIGSFDSLSRILDEADRPPFAAMVRDRLGRAAGRLGWGPAAGEDDLRRQLRGDLMAALGTLGQDSGTQEEAADLYSRMQAGAEVDANVMPAVLGILAHTGEAARYEEFYGRFRRAPDPQEERRYLHALIGFRPADLVNKNLERTLNGDFRAQDAPLLLRSMLTSVHARQAAWEFLKANWPEMRRKYAEIGIRHMWEGVVGLVRPDWEEDVRRYVREAKVELGGRTVEQFLERLHIAVVMRQREGEALSRHLRQF
ncbi:MAG: ERAP1-like C-terminal domain-containing protein, partial [Anaerolineales bacterium]